MRPEVVAGRGEGSGVQQGSPARMGHVGAWVGLEPPAEEQVEDDLLESLESPYPPGPGA